MIFDESQKYDGSTEVIYICKDFHITDIFHDIIEDEQTLKIFYENNIGVDVSVEIKRSDIMDIGLKKMLSTGFNINSNYYGSFMDIVSYFEDEANIQYIHTKLGFYDFDGSLTYLCKKAVGLPIDSVYKGSIRLESRGEINVWLSMVKEMVIPFNPMMFALAAGFSAPIASMLKEKIENSTLLIALSGASSTGKTTALKLIASIYGKPSVSDGIIGDFNDTSSYNIERLAGNNGFIALFDEATTVKSLTDFCYHTTNGVSKGRLSQNGTMKEKRQWEGTVVITCEGSAVDKTNGNEGIFVRTLEVENVAYTESAQHSENIQSVINENFGLAIEVFAEYLLSKTTDEMNGDYNSCLEILIENLDMSNKYSKRIASKFTMILLAARYFSDCFKVVEYKEESLAKFLASVQNEILKRMVERKHDVVECLKDYITRNKSKFILCSNAEEKPVMNPEGKLIVYKDGSTEVMIMKSVFELIMQDNGFNPRAAIKEIDAAGRIVSRHHGRNTCKISLTRGIRSTVYHIKLEDNNSPSVKKLKNLLLDDTDEVEEFLKDEFNKKHTKKSEVKDNEKLK